MEYRARHSEHVSHGYAHMHSAERSVDLHVMRTVLERSRIMTAHLIADACRAFEIVLLHDQLEERRCQVEAYQQLQEKGSGHCANLNSNFGVPCMRRMMLDKYEERNET